MSELTNKKGFPGGTTVKKPSADAGDAGEADPISGSGRSLRGGYDSPL